MDNRQKLKDGINRNMENMDEKELEMVLRFIHSLKDFR